MLYNTRMLVSAKAGLDSSLVLQVRVEDLMKSVGTSTPAGIASLEYKLWDHPSSESCVCCFGQ